MSFRPVPLRVSSERGREAKAMTVSPQAAAPAPVGADRREPGIQPARKAAYADPGAALVETSAAHAIPVSRRRDRLIANGKGLFAAVEMGFIT